MNLSTILQYAMLNCRVVLLLVVVVVQMLILRVILIRRKKMNQYSCVYNYIDWAHDVALLIASQSQK